MTKYLASEEIEWKHPHDFPPPHGTKLLLYMFPYGITVIGEWQNSGATLWAPLPKVSEEMKERLNSEHNKRFAND